MEYKWVKAILEDYGVSMTARMIAILKQRGSQNLIQQFDQKIIDDMDTIMLEISLPSYGYYASEGRSAGKMPPLASIKEWMQSRNIDLAALYPISRKIASMGTKANASHFLKEFKLTSEFEQKVLDAYMLDVEQALKDYVDKMNAEK